MLQLEWEIHFSHSFYIFSSESDSIYTLFHEIINFTLSPYSYIRSLK